MIKKFNRLPIYMTCSLFILLVILTLRCNFFITILAYNSGKNMRIEIKSEDRMGISQEILATFTRLTLNMQAMEVSSQFSS